MHLFLYIFFKNTNGLFSQLNENILFNVSSRSPEDSENKLAQKHSGNEEKCHFSEIYFFYNRQPSIIMHVSEGPIIKCEMYLPSAVTASKKTGAIKKSAGALAS